MNKRIALLVIGVSVCQGLLGEAYGLSIPQRTGAIEAWDVQQWLNTVISENKSKNAADLASEVRYEIDVHYPGYRTQDVTVMLQDFVKVFFERSVRGMVAESIKDYLMAHDQLEISVTESSFTEIFTLDKFGRVKLALGADVIRYHEGSVTIDAMPLFDALAEYCVAIMVNVPDFETLTKEAGSNENVHYWIENLKLVINLDFFPLWVSYQKAGQIGWRIQRQPLLNAQSEDVYRFVLQDLRTEMEKKRLYTIYQDEMLRAILDTTYNEHEILYHYGTLLYNKKISGQTRDRILRHILGTFEKKRLSLARLRDLIFCVCYAHEDRPRLPPTLFRDLFSIQEKVNKVLAATDEAAFYKEYHGLLAGILNMPEKMIDQEIMRLLNDDGVFPKRPGGKEGVNIIEKVKKTFFEKSASDGQDDLDVRLKYINGQYGVNPTPHRLRLRDEQAERERLRPRRGAFETIMRELIKRRYGLEILKIMQAFYHKTLDLDAIQLDRAIEPFPAMLPFGDNADDARALMEDTYKDNTELDYYVTNLFYLDDLYGQDQQVAIYSAEEQAHRVTAMLAQIIALYKTQARKERREEEKVCLVSA